MENPEKQHDSLHARASSQDQRLDKHEPDRPRQYEDAWIRTEWLIGREGLDKLRSATIAVFGLGGVGSYAAESLCRSGVGRLILFDHDRVAASNLNRQLIATHQTMNQLKVEAARDRLLSINPECDVIAHPVFWPADITAEASKQYLPASTDYIIDAIDTVSAKINLVMIAAARDIPIISCMGTGNKLDPGKLCLTDLYQTQTCPLARIMRRELRRRKIASLKVVYSTEAPRKPMRDQAQLIESIDRTTSSQTDSEPLLKQDSAHALKADHDEPGQQISCSAGMTADAPKKRLGPASIAFVPGSAGLMLAAAVVRDLLQTDTK